MHILRIQLIFASSCQIILDSIDSASFIDCIYINSPSALKLDLDFATLKLEDLKEKEISATTREILIQRQIELSSSPNQCSAWNHAKDPTKKTRCSQASKKGCTLCFRHNNLQEQGRPVVLVDL